MIRACICVSALLGSFLCSPTPLLASKDVPQSQCPDNQGRATTTPAPVDVALILEAVGNLKTTSGKTAVELSSELVAKVHDVFDLKKIKTKMEQFYTLLYVLQEHLPKTFGYQIEFDGRTTQAILLKAKVFTQADIPKHIQMVSLNRNNASRPRYKITFDQPRTEVILNRGKGFYLFRNGLCQHARKLIFNKVFSVTLRKNGKGHLVAHNFNGVDLFGTFGNRGIIDVDINYVELQAVEFFRGTPDGKVTAYVSKEEFKKNNHNPLLRVITRFVPDRSVQPIDW